MHGDRGFFIIMGLAMVALTVILVFALTMEAKEWEAFRAKHECRAVEKTRGRNGIGTGIGPNGQVMMITTFEPGKTAWLCNDGVTYWR